MRVSNVLPLVRRRLERQCRFDKTGKGALTPIATGFFALERQDQARRIEAGRLYRTFEHEPIL
jgi:hypothetical protein